jgi:hypothetical protein
VEVKAKTDEKAIGLELMNILGELRSPSIEGIKNNVILHTSLCHSRGQ